MAYRCVWCRQWNDKCTREHPCRARALNEFLKWLCPTPPKETA